MRNAWLRFWTLAVFSVASIAGTVRAEDEIYAEKLLPPETLAFFSIPSVADLREALKDSTFGDMLADPALKPIIADIEAKLNEASAKVKAEIGVTLEELYNLPEGEITFAVVEKPSRKAAVVMMLDAGEHGATLDKLVERMHDALVQEGADHSTQEISDVEVNVYKLTGGNDNPFKTLAYFTDEGYLVIATEVAAIKSVLERWDGDSDDTLASSETFAYIQKKCQTGDEEPLMKWFINPIGIVQTTVGMLQGQNPQAGLVLGMLPILGLDHLKGVGGASEMHVADFESTNRLFIYVEQPATGVLGVFNFPATELKPPTWVAADVSSYSAMNWSVEEAYAAIEAVVDSFQGPGALDRVLDGFAEEEDGPMIHPKKDLIEQFGGPMHIVTATPSAAGDEPAVPKMALQIGVKDVEKMKKTLAKAAKTDGFPGKTREFEGQTIYEMPADNDQTLSLAIAGGGVVFSNDTAAVESIIRGKTAKPLAESAAYKSLAKHYPKQTSIIGFSNAEGQMKAAYEMLRKQDNDSLEGIDLKKLPEWSVLQKYFKPQGSYAVPDKKGALMVGFSLSEK